jgi:dihydrofolate reductase
MRKIIAGMNMTLDGFCDHTAMSADEEIHDHYTEVLQNAGTLVYGRTTYQLMEEYWPGLVENPGENKSMNEFAKAIDEIEKIVYSRTLESVSWRNSILKKEIDKEDILALKNKPGKDILVGSPSMIVALANLGVVDEFQIGLQPILLGAGLQLFRDIKARIDLTLLKTKTFRGGSIMLYYGRV